jgi:hypothetical protein
LSKKDFGEWVGLCHATQRSPKFDPSTKGFFFGFGKGLFGVFEIIKYFIYLFIHLFSKTLF